MINIVLNGDEIRMKIKLASTLRPYDRSNLSADLIAGTVIAAVSIPISMGYSEIAGLPAVYGLYGSVFPIIVSQPRPR